MEGRNSTHPDRLFLDIQGQVADDDLQRLASRLFLVDERVDLPGPGLSGTSTAREVPRVLGPGSGLLLLLLTLRTGRGGSGTGSRAASTASSATGTFGTGGDDLLGGGETGRQGLDVRSSRV